MKIKFYAAEWRNFLPFETFTKKVKEAGYDGIEMALLLNFKDTQKIVANLEKYDLELIVQYLKSFETNIEENSKDFEKYMSNLIEEKSIFLNSQPGKDYFNFQQNK